jgi:peptide/nickel transport system substrate-binding protein
MTGSCGSGRPVVPGQSTHSSSGSARQSSTLGSPRAHLITDTNGANIVGAADVHAGRAKHARGVVAKGRKLIIRLTRPDGAFLPKIALPAFQATSTKLPLSEQVLGPYPTAGPYAFKRLDVNVQTSIRRNPYYTFGPGRHRPRNLAGVDVFWRIDEQTGFEQVKGGELDLGPLPAPEVQGVAEQYGVNKTRVWSEPQNCTGYLPMNMANDLFKNNLPLRRAVNYAIDRKAYVAQSGPYAGKPWTHILNPGVPGWRNVTLYKHNLAKAKRLAAGHLRDGKITVYYHPFSAANLAQAQIVRQDLINIGFQPENITMKDDYREIYDPLGVRGTDADIAVSRGWCSDYPDPYAFINVLFDGNLIRAENSVNWSYMDMPKWNRKMEAEPGSSVRGVTGPTVGSTST